MEGSLPAGLTAILAAIASAARQVASSAIVLAAVRAIRHAFRFLSDHSGLPALVIAAVFVVVGWRILKKSARFAMEVAFVAAALVAATELGWIRW